MEERELKSLISWAEKNNIKTVRELINYSKVCDYNTAKMSALVAKMEGVLKRYPRADYSHIKKFHGKCKFESGCKFAPGTIFEGECEFGDSCEFGEGAVFKSNCGFGDECEFDKKSAFLSECEFGDSCEFGEYITFAGKNKFGAKNEFKSCVFCYQNIFKNNCNFADCYFDKYNRFGHACVLGNFCTLREPCDFGYFTAIAPFCDVHPESNFLKEE